MTATDPETSLAEARIEFRARMDASGARRVWETYSGRIAAVLPGGGARGAYQAGALLAFQDAGLPTHIVTATSIGSINAAAYVANGKGLVGNAEALVHSWFRLTAPEVGVDWMRYLSMFVGVVIASIGFANLLIEVLAAQGFRLHPHEALQTWFVLGIGGAVLALFSEQPSHLAYAIRALRQPGMGRLDWPRAMLSLFGSLAIVAFAILAAHTIHLHSRFREFFRDHLTATLVLSIIAVALMIHRWRYPASWSRFAQQVLRLPLRAALFTNFRRERLFRKHISADAVRASAIHTLFATADLKAGASRFFCNHPPDQLAAERNVDPQFLAREVVLADDPIQAVMASSALPIAFAPVEIAGRAYSDGAITAHRPLRPAIRLGADVLFLVLTQPATPDTTVPRTFLEVGAKALDILMAQNLAADLNQLNQINATCERLASRVGHAPEQVQYELGSQRYRYIKTFSIGPTASLDTGLLSFRATTTAPALLLGYQDAAVQIANFLDYAQHAQFGAVKHVGRLQAQPSA